MSGHAIITTRTTTLNTTKATYPSAAENPVVAYLSSLGSQKSHDTMTYALRRVAAVLINTDDLPEVETIYQLAWHDLRYSHTNAIRAALLQSDHSVSSVNLMLAALRRVLKECWRLGYMSIEDYHRTADIQNVTGMTVPTGRDLDAGEIMALTTTCFQDNNEALGTRDATIIGLLYTCGLRRSEVVKLNVEHLNLETGKVMIRGAKRNKDRDVYVKGGAFDVLHDWLETRGTDTGTLFCRILKGGRILRANRLSSQAVYQMLHRRAHQAGVKSFTPHDLRRTFVGDMLDAGVDIVTVASIAGHSSTNTTSRYDRRGKRAKQDAAGKLHFPYRKREKSDEIIC